jgi:hypothetical protein
MTQVVFWLIARNMPTVKAEYKPRYLIRALPVRRTPPVFLSGTTVSGAS